MSELWWCTVCSGYRRFSTFDTNGFQFLICQRCGQGTCVTPEPLPVEIEESA